MQEKQISPHHPPPAVLYTMPASSPHADPRIHRAAVLRYASLSGNYKTALSLQSYQSFSAYTGLVLSSVLEDSTELQAVFSGKTGKNQSCCHLHRSSYQNHIHSSS